MRVYLVRHGEAKPKAVDPERHLTERGAADVEKVASFLKPLELSVDAVWHSGKARARETAEILGRSVESAKGVLTRDGLAPNDPVAPVKEELDGAAEDLMLVGHLPFMARLAAELVAGGSGEAVSFRQGGVVCIERGEDGSWRIAWAVGPELLP